MVVTENPPENPDSGTRADAELVQALRRGDAEAFRRLVTELNPGLTRLARTYVTEALADEVVQETWAAVVRSIDMFQGRSSLKTWIYRIMMNKVRTLAGREAKIVPFASLGRAGDDGDLVDLDRMDSALLGPGFWNQSPAPWHQLPSERLESDEVLMMIREAIDALPPAQREVVELRDVQGWPAAEVCSALGISSANQRVLLHRGRAAIRSMLEEYLSDDG